MLLTAVLLPALALPAPTRTVPSLCPARPGKHHRLPKGIDWPILLSFPVDGPHAAMSWDRWYTRTTALHRHDLHELTGPRKRSLRATSEPPDVAVRLRVLELT